MTRRWLRLSLVTRRKCTSKMIEDQREISVALLGIGRRDDDWVVELVSALYSASVASYAGRTSLRMNAQSTYLLPIPCPSRTWGRRLRSCLSNLPPPGYVVLSLVYCLSWFPCPTRDIIKPPGLRPSPFASTFNSTLHNGRGQSVGAVDMAIPGHFLPLHCGQEMLVWANCCSYFVSHWLVGSVFLVGDLQKSSITAQLECLYSGFGFCKIISVTNNCY